MIPKPISDITLKDIFALKEYFVQEGLSIDYKLELHSGNPESKREFLADICSFVGHLGKRDGSARDCGLRWI